MSIGKAQCAQVGVMIEQDFFNFVLTPLLELRTAARQSNTRDKFATLSVFLKCTAAFTLIFSFEFEHAWQPCCVKSRME